MAHYAIKMLKDKNDQAFIPFTTTTSVVTEEGTSLQTLLDTKYDIVNNLDTEIGGLGVLDASQGKALADMIGQVPDVDVVSWNDGVALKYPDGTYIYYQIIDNITNENWPLEIDLPSTPSFDTIYYVGLTPISLTQSYSGLHAEYSIAAQNKIKIYVNNDQLWAGLNIFVIGHWDNGEIPSI